jgi:ketosteroid isomerase-like protein
MPPVYKSWQHEEVNVTTRNTNKLHVAADLFIATANSHDVEQVLAVFTPDAVIDAPSTGHYFYGHAGIRNYIEQYFIGYHTVTRLIASRFP